MFQIINGINYSFFEIVNSIEYLKKMSVLNSIKVNQGEKVCPNNLHLDLYMF